MPTYPASGDAQDFRWSSWASPDAGWALNDRPTDRRCVGSWAYRVGLVQRATPRCLLLFSYMMPLVRTSWLMNKSNALRLCGLHAPAGRVALWGFRSFVLGGPLGAWATSWGVAFLLPCGTNRTIIVMDACILMRLRANKIDNGRNVIAIR